MIRAPDILSYQIRRSLLLGTGAFEIRSDPCSIHFLGISEHRPGYFREASISSIVKASWTQFCVFSYVLKE